MIETVSQQTSRDSLSSMRDGNGEVMEITPSRVMSAQNGADNSFVVDGDRAHLRVARQVSNESRRRI
jgi:hypothetical protein